MTLLLRSVDHDVVKAGRNTDIERGVVTDRDMI